MAGVNKVILIGNVGGDPEVKTFDSGDKLVRFSLATSEKYKDREGNPQEATEWHHIVVRRDGLVNVVQQYVKKGDRLFVEGRLRTRKWTDQNGSDRYTTEILMDQIQLLGGPSRNADGQQSASSSTGATNVVSEPAQPSINDIDDDLPF